MKSIGFNSTCLLSPKSSKDREDLNSWWTRTSDGFIYSRKKPKDTALYSAWRCRKRIPPTKCPCHAYLTLSDNSLFLGSKPHNHPADNAAPQKREVLSSLKRKAGLTTYSYTGSPNRSGSPISSSRIQGCNFHSNQLQLK